MVIAEYPDIISLTEIFPKKSLFGPVEEFYNLEGYVKIISDLEIGRGVLIYIKSVLSPIQEIIKNSIHKFNESVWAKIKLNATDTLLVECIYRSPNSTRENTDLLFRLLRNVSKKKFSHILIMGDFNFKEVNWNECTTTVGEDHIATLFLECVRDTFLYQHVKTTYQI